MRLLWLDFLRGLAALSVVGFHFRYYLGIEWMDWGYVSVEVFFVLSGLILGLIYTRKIEIGMSFPAFAKARLLRLYPMVFISGALILILNMAGAPSYPSVPGLNSTPLDVFLITPIHWAKSSEPGWPSNSPVWSLWAELACNALWFVCLRAGDHWVKVIGTVSMIATLVIAHHYKYLGMGSDAGIEARIISFASAMAWFTVGYWMAVKKIRPVVPTWLLVFAVLGSIWLYECGRAHAEWIAATTIVITCTLLINSLYQIEQPSRALARVCGWLGAASFPVYLVHAPLARLLSTSPSTAVHWVSFLAVMGMGTFMATILNEHFVAWLQSAFRSTAAQVSAG